MAKTTTNAKNVALKIICVRCCSIQQGKVKLYVEEGTAVDDACQRKTNDGPCQFKWFVFKIDSGSAISVISGKSL